MEILLILFLTLLNAVFAMSEMALASARRARLDALHAAGDTQASAALRLMNQPTQFLSTVQVGITSISVLTGIVGDSAFSPGVADLLMQIGLAEKPAHMIATACVVTILTFTSIIFGELVPKRIGLLFPEKVARWMAVPMEWLARLAKPFVTLLTITTQAVLSLLRVNTNAAHQVTEEEIAASLVEGVDAGLIEKHEHTMVQNVFRLDERVLSSIMVPRNDVIWLDAALTVSQALQQLTTVHGAATPHLPEHGHIHSWYPVCKGSMDHVLGMVSVGHMLQLGSHSTQKLADIATVAIFVPETLSGMELLEQFRRHAGRLVFVVDEYGDVQGIMTPRDLLEAITGELQPESHTDLWAILQNDGTWLLDGMIPAAELKQRLEIDKLPDEDDDHYNTLAGLLMFISGEMPYMTQKITWQSWEFEIAALDGKRIDKVIARRK